MFKEIAPTEISGNLIDMISNEWMLITAGDKDAYNTMTASWGFAGEIWGNDSVVALIRPQRYTMEFVDKNDYFTLSFYGDNKQIHSVCGKLSGRDVDKAKMCSLTPVFSENAPYFDEARLVLVCKKQYVQQMSADCFTDTEPRDKCYTDDFHYIIIGKIEKVLTKE